MKQQWLLHTNLCVKSSPTQTHQLFSLPDSDFLKFCRFNLLLVSLSFTYYTIFVIYGDCVFLFDITICCVNCISDLQRRFCVHCKFLSISWKLQAELLRDSLKWIINYRRNKISFPTGSPRNVFARAKHCCQGILNLNKISFLKLAFITKFVKINYLKINYCLQYSCLFVKICLLCMLLT